jgi:phage N-6-adenine-methyltransferase
VDWYTPPVIIEAVTKVLGAIDLDPASCREANETVCAENYYTVEDDGLTQSWAGRVWLNPPYARPVMQKFTRKLITEFRCGSVKAAMAITSNATDVGWFQDLAAEASAIFFRRGRLDFWHPEKESGNPVQGQAVFYLGHDVSAFAREFSPTGFVAEMHRGILPKPRR